MRGEDWIIIIDSAINLYIIAVCHQSVYSWNCKYSYQIMLNKLPGSTFYHITWVLPAVGGQYNKRKKKKHIQALPVNMGLWLHSKLRKNRTQRILH